MEIASGIALLTIGLALIASGVYELAHNKVTAALAARPYGGLRVIDGGLAGKPKLKGDARGL